VRPICSNHAIARWQTMRVNNSTSDCGVSRACRKR
jgi:hypothetical protein